MAASYQKAFGGCGDLMVTINIGVLMESQTGYEQNWFVNIMHMKYIGLLIKCQTGYKLLCCYTAIYLHMIYIGLLMECQAGYEANGLLHIIPYWLVSQKI